MSTTTIRFHDGQRYVSALAREGRTKLHVTFIDDCGVVHRAVGRDEGRHVQRLLYHDRDYPLQRMVRHLRRIGRERGITAAATAELRKATG